MEKLLIANRGEITIRIGHTANELGYSTVAVFPEDDVNSLHVKQSDEAVQIPGAGAQAYLNIEAIINVAKTCGADAVHPGYGFLSENPDFAKACEDADINFVGPTAAQLSIFGNKAGARTLAAELEIPLVPGTNEDTSLAAVINFQDQHPDRGVVIKAISGGGGRGMRIIEDRNDIEKNFERCKSEANLAFGDDRVYVESLIPRARHIEVQIVGDGTGRVTHLWERDCSTQRQNQKIIEVAPSPNMSDSTRTALLQASMRMAAHASYRGVGTFEFLVNADQSDEFFFIEANARLQVEHTVTEAITGLDLVALQLRIAAGETLHELELLELITLHLLLAQDVLDLTNLFMQRLNVSLFGHEGLAQITDSLFVQLERIVLREQLIVDGVDEIFGAHLLGFSFLVVFLKFTNHAA